MIVGIGLAARLVVGESLEEPARDRRPEEGVAAGDQSDRVDQVGRPHVLEQESARAGL